MGGQKKNMGGFGNLRLRLLSTASSVVAAASLFGGAPAFAAADADRPVIWLELAGGVERVYGDEDKFSPAFSNLLDGSGLPSPGVAQQTLRYELDEQGKLSFQPSGSDWIFAASVQFGRSNSTRDVHHQTLHPTVSGYRDIPALGLHFINKIRPIAARFIDATGDRRQQHEIIDFSVGRDVGLGFLNRDTTSTVSLGIRFAQFRSSNRGHIVADPNFEMDIHHSDFYLGTLFVHDATVFQKWNDFGANFSREENFQGLGPSLSLDGSMELSGNRQDGLLALDWGINAALLIGRQSAKNSHQTEGSYHCNLSSNCPVLHSSYTKPEISHHRTRTTVVPNIGASVGFSINYPDAKLNLGFKADAFFNAIDGGIDTRHEITRGFYGPFASISIGLGGSSD